MKWVKRILLGIVALVLLAIGTLYAWSAVIINKKYPVEQRTVELSSDPAVLEEGERLSQVFGCFHGCHGRDMEGNVVFEEDWLGRFVAPNITALPDRYSESELEALVRQGVRPDGTSVLGMPSDSFSIMTDKDYAAVMSFVTAFPRKENDPGKTSVGPLGRLGLIVGMFHPAAAVRYPEPWQEGFREDPMKLGEYLAITGCAECHGSELEGSEGFTPPLVIAKAYSREDFQTMMKTGVGLGGRDLGLMSQMTQTRFQHLSEDEIDAIHTFLQTL
jgi:cytochrome c553